jgi:hypothetical protein
MAYQGAQPHSPAGSAYGDEGHRLTDMGPSNVRLFLLVLNFFLLKTSC